MCPTGTSLRPALIDAGDATSEFRQAFDVIDGDHDGKISGEDLRRFYASLSGENNNDDDTMIKVMMTVADANKDGYVQYDEFERVLKDRKKCNNNGDYDYNNDNKGKEKCYSDGGVMEDVFKVMDQDGDGRLGLDDLRSYLGRVGLEVGDEEIKAMIKLGGGDERNGVSFDGFVDILAVHDFVN